MRPLIRMLAPWLSASLVMLAAACTRRPQPIVQPQPAEDTTGLPGVSAERFAYHDSTLLGVVALTIRNMFIGVSPPRIIPVRIDPRRLPQSLDWPATARGSLDDEERATRLDELHAAAVRLVPGLQCALALSPSGSRESCPREEFELVVLGVPRQGPPERQRRSLGAQPIGLTPASWTVRVVQTGIGPHGYAIQSIDYVFEKRGMTWVYVGSVGLAFVE